MAKLSQILMLTVVTIAVAGGISFSIMYNGSLLSSPSSTSISTIQCQSYTLTTPPSPKDAPVEGVEYILIYNASTGSILNMITMSTCNFETGIVSLGLTSSNVSAIASDMLHLRQGTLYIDATSSPLLREITTNGYLNAFYVNPQTGQLLTRPGISFNSSYTVAYYNGQPITNGTQIR